MATIKGKWKFKEVVDDSTPNSLDDSRINLSFESSGQRWSQISIYKSSEYVSILYSLYTEDGPPDAEYLAYADRTWSEAYRTVDFGETEQTIEDEYYNWIVANAVEQTLPEKIYSVKESTMTAIADAIREVTSTENKYTPEQMPQAILDVSGGYTDEDIQNAIEQGKQAEYDRFWGIYQQNGERTNYASAFTGAGWTDETFNPKHRPIRPVGSAESMFYNSGITTLANGVVDFSESTGLYQLSRSCPNLVKLPRINMQNSKTNTHAFGQCPKLKEIECIMVGLDTVFASNTFYYDSELEEVRFEGFIRTSINFQWSPKLSAESVWSIIDQLMDLTGQTTQTLTLHADVKARLTEQQIATITTTKGWTLA